MTADPRPVARGINPVTGDIVWEAGVPNDGGADDFTSQQFAYLGARFLLPDVASSTAATGTLTVGRLARLNCGAASLARTLPAAATAGAAAVVAVRRTDTSTAYTATISPAGSDTINASASARVLAMPEVALTFVSDGVSNWSVVSTDTPASRLSVTYVPLGRGVPGPFDGVRTILDDGLFSTSLHVLGDSTGVGASRWPALLASSIASLYPAFTVLLYPYNASTDVWDTCTTVQTGPLGRRYALIDAVGVSCQTPGDGTNLSGAIDLRAHIEPTAWTGATQTILARFQNAPNRAFRFQLASSGNLIMDTSADGTNLRAGTNSGAAVPFSAGQAGWVRVTYDPADGSTKFYTAPSGTSLDSRQVSWTQLGTTQTGPTGAMANLSTTPYEAGARTNNAERMPGKIYAAEVRTGINGRTVTEGLIDRWTSANQSPYVTFGGSPTFAVVNASYSGAAITDLINRQTNMQPLYGQALTLVSCSHNDTLRTDAAYLADWTSFVTAAKARLATSAFGLVLQNPRTAPAAWIAEHAARRALLTQYAHRNGMGVVDVYRAFAQSSLGLASLVQGDGIHPSDATGSPLWAATVLTSLQAKAFA